MAGTEGTIPDTSTLSKSIKKPTTTQPKLLEADPLALKQEPSLLWKDIAGKFHHIGKPRFFFFFFFTEQGGTQSGVRDEGGWLKGTSLLFQNFSNLHDHSWLIKTKI